ncbi:uncharacterized protein LOC105693736 isoform X2 [Athalia rosae]|uniref:uncharacterized protein LOC105693736 isoform X2 n=1 Tax=Athalia rosae TaxID=37344 RepID=UPI002033346E|nr:uncharacterized protein LOC105693736 isoform X2 [Athalia rosae]
MEHYREFTRCIQADCVVASSLVEEPFVRDKFLNRPKNPRMRIKIVGLLTTIAFQKARLMALKVHEYSSFRFAEPEIRGLMQIDWREYLEKMRQRFGGQMWMSEGQVVVFVDDAYIGNDKDFWDYVTQNYVFRLPEKIDYYQTSILEQWKQCMENSKRDYVYFTFTIDNQTIGSFLFMLYSDLLPRTCKNFLSLCIGDSGQTSDGIHLHYKNTLVHRIVKNGWLQIGDIELIRGGGGTAANGGVIPDESFCVPHNRCGVLSMANNGKDSNGSQFIVSIKPNPWMDYYYVAFGQLVDGAETLRKIEQVPTVYEKPLRRIVISRCGEYFFGDEPVMEAGPDAFGKHGSERSSRSGESGECPSPCKYRYSGYPGVKPWLDNVADKLDDRDTISLLMAERYLGGLYSLATDYLPGTDMLPSEPAKGKSNGTPNLDMSRVCPTGPSPENEEFVFNFDANSDDEKISLICSAGREIVACALEFCNDEVRLDTLNHTTSDYTIRDFVHQVSLERISMDSAGTAQWILELACEIAAAALARAKSVEKLAADVSEDQRQTSFRSKKDYWGSSELGRNFASGRNTAGSLIACS